MIAVAEHRLVFDQYAVHLKAGSNVEFEVYGIYHWKSLDNESEGVGYYDKETGQPDHGEFIEGKCEMSLEGAYSWRGVWEGRLYFTKDEYWGSDMKEMNDLYYDVIVPWCRKYLGEKLRLSEKDMESKEV